MSNPLLPNPDTPIEDLEQNKFQHDQNDAVAVNVISANMETVLLQILASLNSLYALFVSQTLLFLVDDSSNQLVDDIGNNLQG